MKIAVKHLGNITKDFKVRFGNSSSSLGKEQNYLKH